MNKELMFWIAVLVSGILCLAKGIFDRVTAVRLKGKVIDYILDGNGIYFKIIQFQYNGQEMRMKAANGSEKQKGAVGEAVEIMYRPKNQKYVYIIGDNKDIVISVVLLVCGGVMVCLRCLK